jgi:hypothetical protein
MDLHAHLSTSSGNGMPGLNFLQERDLNTKTPSRHVRISNDMSGKYLSLSSEDTEMLL